MRLIGAALKQDKPQRIWAAFIAVAIGAWALTLQNMAMAPSMMGVPSLPYFLPMWLLMMIAMMFPSVAPMAIVWSNGIARTTSGAVRVSRLSAFIAGYLLAWSLYGFVAFAAIVAIASESHMHPQSARWLTVGLFAFAGVYQLTPLKRACLRHCRAPFVALMHYATWSPRARDFRVGLHHGAYCVGCCWGLMAILIAVGVMNVPAMVLVTAIILLEKVWRHGEVLAKAFGVAFLAFAFVAI